MKKRQKGYFSISAVAKMFSVHQQTIRLYEKEGLISPKRSEGNTRLFSEDDVNKLEEVIYLTHELGINLAGVEMILKLQRHIKKLQGEMNKAFESTQDDLGKDIETAKKRAESSAKRLVTLKKGEKPLLQIEQQKVNQKTVFDIDQDEDAPVDEWQVEYEE